MGSSYAVTRMAGEHAAPGTRINRGGLAKKKRPSDQTLAVAVPPQPVIMSSMAESVNQLQKGA